MDSDVTHCIVLHERQAVPFGPRKPPSLKAWLPLSLCSCLKSKVSHPLIPQRGSQQTSPGKELLYGNTVNVMTYIIMCATCRTNESIQLCENCHEKNVHARAQSLSENMRQTFYKNRIRRFQATVDGLQRA